MRLKQRHKEECIVPSLSQPVPNIEAYGVGSILKIVLVNFLTYNRCVIVPGPAMNMVVGANGTGKSSIVCAIALGLGFSPAVLGRTKDVGSFVKYGESTATVEIWLKIAKPPGFTRIRRTINAAATASSASASEWNIDGQRATARSVSELVTGLCIQVDNLCQFLAQDRVGEFARMDGVFLFRETLKAASPRLVEQLDALVRTKANYRAFETEVTGVAAEVAALRSQNAAVQLQVERLHERQASLSRISLLDAKRRWLRYDAARNEYLKIRGDRDALRRLLDEAMARTAPLQAEAATLHAEAMRIDASVATVFETHQTAANSHNALAAEGISEVQRLRTEFRAAAATRESRAQEAARLRAEIAALEEETRRFAPAEDEDEADAESLRRIADAVAAAANSRSARERAAEAVQRAVDAATADINAVMRQMATLQDAANVRLEALRRESHDAATAASFIDANRSRFVGDVYAPAVLHVELLQAEFAAEFEDLLSFQALTMIVCVEAADFEFLQAALIDEQRLKVNIHRQQASIDNYSSLIGRSELASLGFDGYLADVIRAPDVVKAALCHVAKIHLLPVTKRRVDEERLFATAREIQRFAADGLSWSVYADGGERIVRTKRIGRAKVLAAGADATRKAALDARLADLRAMRDSHAAQHKQLWADIQPLLSRENELKTQRDALIVRRRAATAAAQQHRTKCDRIGLLRRQLAALSSTRDGGGTAAEASLVQRISAAISAFDAAAAIRAARLTLFDAAAADASFDVCRAAVVAKKHSLLLLEVERLALRNKSLAAEHANCVAAYAAAKAAAKTLLDEANALPPLSADDRAMADAAPDSIDAIDAEVARLKASVEMFSDLDVGILAAYEQRTAQIDALMRRLATHEAQLQQEMQHMLAAKRDFETHVEPVVRHINDKFSTFFRLIDCAGAVTLQKRPAAAAASSSDHSDAAAAAEIDETEFDAWRIEIMVKFRETAAFAQLSHHRQSGGERSVATFLYLMALQGISQAPFRVVDEINQGMDAVNEAKMHDVLLETSERDAKSQYFLVTPKLLPNLAYNRNVTVICLFSGAHIPPHDDCNEAPFTLASFLE